MSLLEKPEAHALLEDAQLSPSMVRACSEHLSAFLQRYLPRFYREEQRALAELVIQGKLSGLERKTSEPIANQAGRHRKPVQHFVGAGLWDDEAVMAEIRMHVCAELGDPRGVFVVDGSAFPKKGTESCGVARQWCGRLGKIDNCQVGVFLAYAGPTGWGPLDRRLYLPEEWATARERRKKTYVPKEVVFQEKWRLGLELIAKSSPEVPHGWIAADDEFGRVTEFRAALRLRRERYVLDVPCNTLVRDVSTSPRSLQGRKPAFERAAAWAARQPASRWKTLTLRGGEKGPLRVQALKARVQTKDEDGGVGPIETLLVVRPVEKNPTTYYALSNADRKEKLAALARVKSERHRVEEMFQEGNGEVGLDHYEVRSWSGWHHHMTLALLALWFLQVEKRRVGKKNAGHQWAPDTGNLQSTAASTTADSQADRRRNQSGAAA
jgi:SRSO17 transposase